MLQDYDSRNSKKKKSNQKIPIQGYKINNRNIRTIFVKYVKS